MQVWQIKFRCWNKAYSSEEPSKINIQIVKKHNQSYFSECMNSSIHNLCAMLLYDRVKDENINFMVTEFIRWKLHVILNKVPFSKIVIAFLTLFKHGYCRRRPYNVKPWLWCDMRKEERLNPEVEKMRQL